MRSYGNVIMHCAGFYEVLQHVPDGPRVSYTSVVSMRERDTDRCLAQWPVRIMEDSPSRESTTEAIQFAADQVRQMYLGTYRALGPGE